MRRRVSMFMALATAAACGRHRETSPLDRDATLHTVARDSVTANRVTELLSDAGAALAIGDTAAAEGALAGAVTVADTNATLVARVADQGLALGLAGYAELGYRRYLTLAPEGPLAEQARERLSLLTPAQTRAARAPHRTVARSEGTRVPELANVARPAARARAVARPARAATTVASAVTARPTPSAPGTDGLHRDGVRGDGARGDGASAAPAPQPAASDDGVIVGTSLPEAPAPVPAASGTRRSSTGTGAVVGAVSGAAIGAVLGHGARGALVGMVTGGALGAAVGSTHTPHGWR